MSIVTTTYIVENLQTEIDAVRAAKNLDIKKRIKLSSILTGQQLRAGGLQVAYLKAVTRLPEEAHKNVLNLTGNPVPPKQLNV